VAPKKHSLNRWTRGQPAAGAVGEEWGRLSFTRWSERMRGPFGSDARERIVLSALFSHMRPAIPV